MIECQRCCCACRVIFVECLGTWKHAERHHSAVATATQQSSTWPRAHSSLLTALPLKPLLMTEAQRNLHPGDLSTTNVASYDSKLLLWMNNNFIPAGCVRVRVCALLQTCALNHHQLVAAAWSCDQGPLITVRSGERTSFLSNNMISPHFQFFLWPETRAKKWQTSDWTWKHPGVMERRRVTMHTILDSLKYYCFNRRCWTTHVHTQSSQDTQAITVTTINLHTVD